MESLKYPHPNELKISTYTIISHIFEKEYLLNLNLLSRLIKVNNEDDKECDSKEGCIISVEYFSNLFKGNKEKTLKYFKNILNYTTNNKEWREKKYFSNQVTINFNYFKSRKINIFIFNNGELKMAGINSKFEGEDLTKKIINIVKKTKIKIYINENDLMKETENIFNDFRIFYNYKTNKLSYYRFKYYDIIVYLELLKIDVFTKEEKDKYFENNLWISKIQIDEFIQCIESKKDNYNKELINKNKESVDIENEISKEYIISQEKFNENKNKLFKSTEDKKKLEFYINNLERLLKKLKNIVKYDCETINLIEGKLKEELKLFNETVTKLILSDNTIKDKTIYYDYDIIENVGDLKMNNLQIVLINSNFNTRFYINNTKLNSIIKNKYKIFSSYEPNDYPAVKNIYFYNEYKDDEGKEGRCFCEPRCFNKSKKKITCSKITISIFDTGSVLIVTKTLEQLKKAYEFINKLFKDNFEDIKRKTTQINNQEEINNNRVLNKKQVYYFKKDNTGIEDYDFTTKGYCL